MGTIGSGMSIRYKLIIPLIAVELLMFGMLAWNTEFYLQNTIRKGTTTIAQTTAELVAQQYTEPLAWRNITQIEEHLRWISREKNLYYIVIEDAQGRVVASNRPQEGFDQSTKRFLGLFNMERKIYDVRAPIIFENRRLGEVRLGFSAESIFPLVSSGRSLAVIIALVAICLSTIVIWLVIKAVTRPLIGLTSITRKLAEGDLTQTIETGANDEVGQLSKAFKNMVTELKESYSTLKEKVKSRTHELHNRNQQLEALFNGITDIITVQDVSYNIIEANKSALASCSSAEIRDMRGRKCYEAYRELSAPCRGCPVEETIETGKSAFSEHEIDDRVYHLYSYPVLNEDGEIREIIVFKKDLTHERALEQQLAHSARLAVVGELAACVANDIMNPLAGISGCSQVLKKRQDKESFNDELLGLILADVNRLEEVVRRFLDFAELTDSGMKVLELNGEIEKTLSLIEERAKSQGVAVERDFQSGNLVLLSNGQQLRQALLNIFINALQAIPDGGRLRIQTRSFGNKARILVSDSRAEVHAESKEKIFDAFFSTKPQGPGLGLCIAQMIVEKHEGSIRVGGDPGKGMVISIDLPLNGNEKSFRTVASAY